MESNIKPESDDPYTFNEKFNNLDIANGQIEEGRGSIYVMLDKPMDTLDLPHICKTENPIVVNGPKITTKKRDFLNIHCSTINCGGQTPESVQELLPIFHVNDQASIDQGFEPDIYIVAMQEIVPLNAMSVMKKDHKKIEEWRKLLEEALDIVNSELIAKRQCKAYSQDELFDQ
jgi:hypothetical protein